MKVKILKESGYDEAILGLSLSYNTTIERAEKAAMTLCTKNLGHNGFLEQVYVWLDISAPRYWWMQASRYRYWSQLSESTMHTILRKELIQSDFEKPIPEGLLNNLNTMRKDKDILGLKNLLPEGFIQRRVVCVNYKSLRNVLAQRKDHKLIEWELFCQEIMKQVGHPDFFKDI